MADENLNIKIETQAVGDGAKQTSAALGEVERELNNLSLKTKDYIKGLEEQEQKEKSAVASKGEIRRGLREIGAEIPILGEVGRLAMEPLVGAFVLLATVVSAALEGIKELGNRSTPEFQRLTQAVQEQKEAMEQVDLAANAYNRSLERLANAGQGVEAASNAYTSRIKAQADRQGEIDAAMHARSGALLKAAEENGLITHRDYIAKRLALDEAYAQKQIDLLNKVERANVEAKFREKANAEIDANTTAGKLGSATAAQRAAAGNAAFAAGRTAADEKDLDATKDKVKELEKEILELKSKTEGLGAFSTVTPQVILEEQKAQAEKELEDSIRIQAQLQDKLKQDREAGFNATDKKNAADEDVNALRERIKNDKDLAKKLGFELPQDAANLNADTTTRATVQSLKNSTSEISVVPELAKQSAAAMGVLNTDLSQALRSISGNATEMINVAGQMVPVIRTNTDDIAKLRNDLNNVIQRQRQQTRSQGDHT